MISDHDETLLVRIVKRAVALANEHDRPLDPVRVVVDLVIAHKFCPLDLDLLLDAPDQDFAHDVWGIMRHLDRSTGALRDCFLPRTARIQHEHDASDH